MRRADAALVGRIRPAARTALAGDDPLNASDVLSHGAERQKRRLRIATAVHSPCPEFSPDPQYATEVKVTGRAEEVIATVERARPRDHHDRLDRRRRRRVPLAQLLAPSPQTYTFGGTQHFTEMSEGDAASFDNTWSYTVTIRRI